jgi:hypothetical protein
MDRPEGEQAKLTQCEYDLITRAFEKVKTAIVEHGLFETEVYEKTPRPACYGAKEILEDFKKKLKVGVREKSREGVMSRGWNASLRHGRENGCVWIKFLLGRKKKRGSRECETLAMLEIVEVPS